MERDEQSKHYEYVDQCQPPKELGDVVRIIGWYFAHCARALSIASAIE